MAHNEKPVEKFKVAEIEFKTIQDTTPTLTLSGSLFLSGGLWFKGESDTYTQLAAA